jgi:hypothetical protein
MSTGLDQNNDLNHLSVYPNPANEKATISIVSPANEMIHYSLMDVTGKVIEQKDLEVVSGINTLEININQLHLSKGIYFIKLSSNGEETVKKLIVE